MPPTGGRKLFDRRDDLGSVVNGYGVAFCPRCSGPALLEFTTYERYIRNIISTLNEGTGLVGGESLVDVIACYPPTQEPETNEAWPDELVRQFSDAQRMLVMGMTPSLVVGTCRTVLDIATKKLGDAGAEKNLSRRIDHLLAQGIITKPIAVWAHTIRLDGNDAVHDGTGNEDDAREYVAFLKMFLNVAFTLPKRIDERRNQGGSAQAG